MVSQSQWNNKQTRVEEKKRIDKENDEKQIFFIKVTMTRDSTWRF